MTDRRDTNGGHGEDAEASTAGDVAGVTRRDLLARAASVAGCRTGWRSHYRHTGSAVGGHG